MPDLDTLLAAATRADTPSLVAGPPARARRDPRRRRTLSLAGVGAVAAVVVAGLVVSLPSQSPERLIGEAPTQDRAPDVLEVTCTATGAEVGTRRVSVQPDGVHYRFTNATGREARIALPLQGEALPAGATREIVNTATLPGQSATVSCADSVEMLDADAASFTAEDPDGVYLPVPPCEGPSAIRSFATGTARKGDPLDLTREDHPMAEVVGYPEGNPRQIFTGTQLIGWEEVGVIGSERKHGWVPSYLTECG